MSDTTGKAPTGRGVYLLTHPRSASNLFQTMLSDQPGYHCGYSFYDGALQVFTQIPRGRLSDFEPEQRDNVYNAYHSSWKQMQNELSEAQQKHQKVLMKEHACFLYGPETLWSDYYPESDLPSLTVGSNTDDPAASSSPSTRTNPTCLPDQTLLSMQPIFQIRSPLLMFPSLVRASRNAKIAGDMTKNPCLTLRYSRKLYDWYAAHPHAMKPLVIDADDIMGNRTAVRELCLGAGLDPDALRYEWDAKKQETHAVKAHFLGTINNSTGILPGLEASGLSLEVESGKWREEFGERDGGVLTELVRAAMPDYEFLRGRSCGAVGTGGS